MTLKRFQFSTALVLLGGLMAAGVAFDLGYRGFHRHPHHPEWPLPDADRERGRQAIVEFGCGACHVIPGVRQATGRVGPRLDDFASQLFIAGVLPNTGEHLVEWIQHPQQINPQTAMPDLGVTEEQARDIAAFLYQVR